jgi:hypothetical protein
MTIFPWNNIDKEEKYGDFESEKSPYLDHPL